MPELTPDALVDLDIPSEVAISPAADKVVYKLQKATKKGDNEVSSLWIADVGKEHSARQLTSGQFNDRLPEWSPDGKTVAFLSDRTKAGKSCAIYTLSMDGGEAYAVTNAENERMISMFRWSPCGKFIAFLSADEKSGDKKAKEKEKDDAKVYGEDWPYRRMRLLHVATREVTVLYEEKKHVDAFTWHHESSTPELAYRLTQTPDINSGGLNGTEIESVDVATKKSRHLCKFPGSIFKSLAWVGDDFRFIATVKQTVSQSSLGVYALDMETLQYKLLYGHRLLRDAVDILFTGTGILTHFQEGTRDEIDVEYNPWNSWNVPVSWHRHRSAISSLSAGGFWLSSEHRTLCGKVCVATSDSGKPPEVYSFNRQKDREYLQEEEDPKYPDGNIDLCQLSNHNSKLADPHSVSTVTAACEAEGGTKIEGVWQAPNVETPMDGFPTVVLVHGGPYGRAARGFDPFYFHWAPYLVSTGYAVLCPNYRGSSGYGDDFTSSSQGGMGTLDYSDTITLLNHVIKEGLVDKERVIIGGWSQGGFLSYLATTRSDFSFRGAICGAGVTDWDMMCMSSDAYWFETELTGKAPWEADSDSTKGRHGSAIWHMKNVETPVLILHGEDDVRVPVSQAHAFRRGCEKWGVPYEMVTYPREPHMISERAHRLDMLKRVRRFVDTHIGS